MKKCSLYNSEVFWSNCLGKTDVWQGAFSDQTKTGTPMYINCIIMDKAKKVISCDWASYPSAHATLGFIQYVYMPTLFNAILDSNSERLYTPVMPTEDFISKLEDSDHALAGKMIFFLKLSQNMWQLCNYRLTRGLLGFARLFNEKWYDDGGYAKLDIYASPIEVLDKIQNVFWDEEVFNEETGMEMYDVQLMSEQAMEFEAHRILFVYFLNHKVGCLV